MAPLPALPLPSPRPLLRTAIVAISSCLWLASCGPGSSDARGSTGSSDAVLGSLTSPLGSSRLRPRTLLVHLYYQTDEDLARFSEELDLLEHADRTAGYVDALVDEATYASLLEKEYRVEIDEAQTALMDQASSMGTMSIPGFTCYRSVEETYASMAQLEATYPGLVRLVDAGDTYDKVNPGGNPGYDMQVMVATNEAIPGPKPRFFLMGAIHAREYTTAETVMRFAEQLVTGYGTDPDATWLLDNYELHVLPQTNPDGRKLAEQGYYQRKNLRPGGNCSNPPTASNQSGIDLNRNSSYGWGGSGSSTSLCDQTYRGASAASEPETAAVQSYVASIFADQRGPGASDPAPSTTTGVMITLHSYADLVLYPWGNTSTSAPNLAQLATLGRKFGYFNHYEVCQAPICLYSASGTTDDWAYGQLGIASYTFEIGGDFFESCSSFTQTVLPDNLAALRTAFKHARLPYQTPKGPDAVNVAVSATSVPAGTVVTLTATVDDTRYDSNGWGTEPTQNIAAARYTVDKASWASGAIPLAMSASDGTFNAKIEGVRANVSTAGWKVGRHLVLVEGRDASGNWGAPTGVFIDIIPGAFGQQPL